MEDKTEAKESRRALLEVVTKLCSKDEKRIRRLESRLDSIDNQDELDKELLGSYVELTIATMLTKGMQAMDTPDSAEEMVERLGVPLGALVMRKDDPEEREGEIREVFTNNLGEIAELCLDKGVEQALVTINELPHLRGHGQAHPGNGSDEHESPLPPLIMEPINEQGVAHPVLEPVRLGEEADQSEDMMDALRATLRRQYYGEDINDLAEERGGQGGNAVLEEGVDRDGIEPV
jgi:hypothetical protein